ncbi:DUF1614 domain-containing protein [Salidesulfovibrio onnuriiensis]|uniref:DUF1614 domain-containing protein n=1 Tax=Salidesulfovibrio onnuriiensis TaxID=2583823 RepID=UPI00202B4F3D|nr:DUF1614 domain-containing protein [Salidesulfovibrio onnuriiensis]
MIRPPQFHFTGGLVFAILFLVALFFLFVFLPVSIVTESFSRLGVTPGQGILLLLAILLGRAVNIPVYTSQRLVMVNRSGSFEFTQGPMGDGRIRIQEPANELKRQEFVVNLGGCVLPVVLSVTFALRLALGGQGLGAILIWAGLCALIVAVACYALVRPDAVSGLRIPLIAPALVTMLTVWLLSPKDVAPIVAYMAGSVGTIVGACVAPVLTPRIRNSISAPVVSIGGAGTFGGIFLAGVLAVFFI